jgi:hypothetical protein
VTGESSDWIVRMCGWASTAASRRLTTSSMTRSLELSEKVGIHAVVVDALDADAKSFYVRFGFLPLTVDAMRLFLPMSTIQSAAKP